MEKLVFNDGDTVLVAGDSITDCERRTAYAPYGNGYVAFFIDLAAAAAPQVNVRYVNKGIGGDTVLDLEARWQDDVIREKPNWLSVMIGINDLDRTLTGQRNVEPEIFARTYNSILERAVDECDSRLILVDPFFLSTDRSGKSFRTRYLDGLASYIAIVDELSEKYGAMHLKMQDVFKNHLRYRPADYFCAEPVHPSRTGHQIIAWELLNLVKS